MPVHENMLRFAAEVIKSAFFRRGINEYLQHIILR